MDVARISTLYNGMIFVVFVCFSPGADNVREESGGKVAAAGLSCPYGGDSLACLRARVH